jgi:hypothetical protein
MSNMAFCSSEVLLASSVTLQLPDCCATKLFYKVDRYGMFDNLLKNKGF